MDIIRSRLIAGRRDVVVLGAARTNLVKLPARATSPHMKLQTTSRRTVRSLTMNSMRKSGGMLRILSHTATLAIPPATLHHPRIPYVIQWHPDEIHILLFFVPFSCNQLHILLLSSHQLSTAIMVLPKVYNTYFVAVIATVGGMLCVLLR